MVDLASKYGVRLPVSLIYLAFLLKLILSEDDDSDVGADLDAGRIDKSPHNNNIGNTDDKLVV